MSPSITWGPADVTVLQQLLDGSLGLPFRHPRHLGNLTYIQGGVRHVRILSQDYLYNPLGPSGIRVLQDVPDELGLGVMLHIPLLTPFYSDASWFYAIQAHQPVPRKPRSLQGRSELEIQTFQ